MHALPRDPRCTFLLPVTRAVTILCHPASPRGPKPTPEPRLRTRTCTHKRMRACMCVCWCVRGAAAGLRVLRPRPGAAGAVLRGAGGTRGGAGAAAGRGRRGQGGGQGVGGGGGRDGAGEAAGRMVAAASVWSRGGRGRWGVRACVCVWALLLFWGGMCMRRCFSVSGPRHGGSEPVAAPLILHTRHWLADRPPPLPWLLPCALASPTLLCYALRHTQVLLDEAGIADPMRLPYWNHRHACVTSRVAAPAGASLGTAATG